MLESQSSNRSRWNERDKDKEDRETDKPMAQTQTGNGQEEADEKTCRKEYKKKEGRNSNRKYIRGTIGGENEGRRE